MAIQRGNAFCAMGCPKNISTSLEGLFNFQVHEAFQIKINKVELVRRSWKVCKIQKKSSIQ